MNRSITLRLGVAIVACFCCADRLVAGELNPARIPASARFVAHVDVEMFLRSRLVEPFQKQLRAEMERNGVPDGMRQVIDKLGFDPLKDVFSVTVFSAEDTPERAVVLVETSSALDQAIERSGEWLDRETIEEDGMNIQRWTEKGGDQTLQFSSVLKADDRRLLLASQHAEDLVKALKV